MLFIANFSVIFPIIIVIVIFVIAVNIVIYKAIKGVIFQGDHEHDELSLDIIYKYKNKELAPNISLMERGETYFKEGKIKDFKVNNNTYTCNIKGTKSYKVKVKLNESDSKHILNKTCNCPYFKEHDICKHIYALLYNINSIDNEIILKEEIESVKRDTNRLISNFKFYLNQHKLDNKQSISRNISSLEDAFKKSIDDINKRIDKDIILDREYLYCYNILLGYHERAIKLGKEIESKPLLDNVGKNKKN